MLHQGFSESAGKVLNNFKCVWVTDMWIIVSSLQLPLHWTTLNNKQRLRLTVSLLRLSPLKVINLFVSSRLISRFLPSLISVFLPVFCRSPSLPVAPRASVESWFACDPIVVPVCVRAKNLHVGLTVTSVLQNILCLGGFILAHAPNNRLLISCVNLLLLLFCFLSAPPCFSPTALCRGAVGNIAKYTHGAAQGNRRSHLEFEEALKV